MKKFKRVRIVVDFVIEYPLLLEGIPPGFDNIHAVTVAVLEASGVWPAKATVSQKEAKKFPLVALGCGSP